MRPTGILIACKSSRSVGRLFPSEAYVLVQSDRRKAMADQIATISKRRLKEHIWELSPADMRSVEHTIAIQLGIG